MGALKGRRGLSEFTHVAIVCAIGGSECLFRVFGQRLQAPSSAGRRFLT